MIDVTAWAPTREIGLAFMQAVGIVKVEDGRIVPLVNVQISADDWSVPGVDGWHVNVRHTDEAPELEAFRVFPQTPSRMWA